MWTHAAHPDDCRARSRASRALFAASVLLGALACAIDRGGRKEGPRQGWWKGHGLVVPHESFPADCSLCHTGEGWHEIRDDFAFDHEQETGVALRGAHEGARCLRCHNDRGPVAVFASRGCAGCHEDVHRGRMGSGCADCHDETSWRPNAAVAQHARTRFPLVGAHAAAPCWRCHPGSEVGVFERLDVECLACHAGDLARATEPDHQALGWVDRCDRCHIPTTWTGGGFSHASFPLTGAHARADCADCHTRGIFTGLPQDCVSCHLADYQNAREPNHLTQGFPTSCELCHDTNSWSGAMFNHAGISSGCVRCHLVDYQNTRSPSHVAAGFPTTCELCHIASSWQPATFDHSFPITSGDHAGFNCADCHLNPRSFRVFSCTHCHEHSQREMDDEHDDVRGYVWESTACLACHPTGRR